MIVRLPEPRIVAHLRALSLALPEARETVSHGAPTWWAKTRTFAIFSHAETHHGMGRHGVWLKAAPENQRYMVAARPDRFFVPPYVGPSGWVGVYLDADTDWAELAELLHDAWRHAAPPAVLKRAAPDRRDLAATVPRDANATSAIPATPPATRPRGAKAAARPASRGLHKE